MEYHGSLNLYSSYLFLVSKDMFELSSEIPVASSDESVSSVPQRSAVWESYFLTKTTTASRGISPCNCHSPTSRTGGNRRKQHFNQKGHFVHSVVQVAQPGVFLLSLPPSLFPSSFPFLLLFPISLPSFLLPSLPPFLHSFPLFLTHSTKRELPFSANQARHPLSVGRQLH